MPVNTTEKQNKVGVTDFSFRLNNHMRAREFIINIPINVKINGDDEPEISTVSDHLDSDEVADTQLQRHSPMKNDEHPLDDDEVGSNFVPPLQQKIELMKKAAGKDSRVIDQITADEDDLPEP